jgi:hypothetical protein
LGSPEAVTDVAAVPSRVEHIGVSDLAVLVWRGAVQEKSVFIIGTPIDKLLVAADLNSAHW